MMRIGILEGGVEKLSCTNIPTAQRLYIAEKLNE